MQVEMLISSSGEWLGDDFEALKLLKENGIVEKSNGQLRPPHWPFDETPEVRAAINYLCYEWDYEYGPGGPYPK